MESKALDKSIAMEPITFLEPILIRAVQHEWLRRKPGMLDENKDWNASYSWSNTTFSKILGMMDRTLMGL